MELGTALVWIIRIVLPIILFWVYFKLSSPRDEPDDEPSISRAIILAQRKYTVRGDPPPGLANLTLVDASKAPALFGGRATSRGQARRTEDRDHYKERRERRGEGRKERAEKQEEVVDEVPQEHKASEEKMHMESLLNYVAFNRREPKRVFLPDEASAPPPPPPPRPKKTDDATEGSGKTGPPVEDVKVDNANMEAQMVLKGAINVARAEVAKDLYEHLAESNIDVSDRTFSLMIEACVLAKDLKSAKNFLVKMEAAGFEPDTQTLDKLTDLYSQQKHMREQDRSHEDAEAAGTMGGDLDNTLYESLLMGEQGTDGPRPKLSSQAPVFTPMSLLGESNAGVTKSRVALDASSTPFQPMQRTALKSSATPFQPQGNVTYDPDDHTWTYSPPGGEGEDEDTPEQAGEARDGSGNGKVRRRARNTRNEEAESKPKPTNTKAAAKKGVRQWKVKSTSTE